MFVRLDDRRNPDDILRTLRMIKAPEEALHWAAAGPGPLIAQRHGVLPSKVAVVRLKLVSLGHNAIEKGFDLVNTGRQCSFSQQAVTRGWLLSDIVVNCSCCQM